MNWSSGPLCDVRFMYASNITHSEKLNKIFKMNEDVAKIFKELFDGKRWECKFRKNSDCANFDDRGFRWNAFQIHVHTCIWKPFAFEFINRSPFNRKFDIMKEHSRVDSNTSSHVSRLFSSEEWGRGGDHPKSFISTPRLPPLPRSQVSEVWIAYVHPPPLPNEKLELSFRD